MATKITFVALLQVYPGVNEILLCPRLKASHHMYRYGSVQIVCKRLSGRDFPLIFAFLLFPSVDTLLGVNPDQGVHSGAGKPGKLWGPEYTLTRPFTHP